MTMKQEIKALKAKVIALGAAGLIVFLPASASDLQKEAPMTMKQEPSLEIVDIDDTPGKAPILTGSIKAVTFPLTEKDKKFIEALKAKVIELGAAGLAAPQVGVAQQIIAFQVPIEALKYRDDVTGLVELTVLSNPSYVPIESEGHALDWERCFSGKNHAGKVRRPRAIRYKAQDINGNPVEGVAYGFLARLLQHETDHCHGKLCFQNSAPESPKGSPEALKAVAEEEIRKKKQKMGLRPDDNFPLLSPPSSFPHPQ